MPKLGGPLFSVEARKSLAKALSYQRRPGGASVYGYNKPKVPLTTAQHTQRDKIMWCVLSWRRLPDASKAEWEAKAKGQGQSGYSYFVSQTCGYIFDPECVLYLPLYYPELSGGSFKSRDSYGHLSTVTDATWGSLGRTFGGAAKIDCGNGASINQEFDELTVGVWAKKTANPATTYGGIVSKGYGLQAWGNGTRGAYDLNIHGATGTIYWTIQDTDEVVKSISGGVADTEWHYWVGTFKKSDFLKLYKDAGTPASTATGVLPLKLCTRNLGIGWTHGLDYYFKGVIGEVWIYNRALTPLEIQHNYLVTKWRYR